MPVHVFHVPNVRTCVPCVLEAVSCAALKKKWSNALKEERSKLCRSLYVAARCAVLLQCIGLFCRHRLILSSGLCNLTLEVEKLSGDDK
jgi:hypothetical protein